MTRAAVALLFALATSRGKQIYTHGESPSGAKIEAMTGSEVVLPAAVMPCINCHGADGRGVAEGGIRPSDIRHDALARLRPPYTKRLLTRAITMGIGADGRELNLAMPRYRMTRDDMQDLLAYLDLLGTEAVPGVSDEAIAIRVVGPRAEIEQTVAAVNQNGIYGRKLVLSDADPFAIIDPSPTADATAALPIPSIIGSARVSTPSAFQLLAGPRELVSALLAQPIPHNALLIAGDDAASFEAEAASAGWTHVVAVTDPSSVPLDGIQTILLLGGPQTPALLARIPPSTLVLAPASALPSTIHHAMIAFPEPPSADAARATARLAITILVDALRAIGRDLTREKLVAALETVRREEVAWTPTRHVGSSRAYVVTIE